ncbi:hypothetical protein IFM89_001765 [Coptis chinensis]|uniref:Uncharacterized protein n=1 Tax=Coptis chinensis TaxID=261450 RepID=A0A835HI12_9MAGN|nr:hypothetical protein IFM89_001765 [Coptis chinensis]
MDDFPGLKDFGIRPQGKAAPMNSNNNSNRSSSFSSGVRNKPPSILDDTNLLFRSSSKTHDFDNNHFDMESIFQSGSSNNNNNFYSSGLKSPSLPVFDKPVYDDDGGGGGGGDIFHNLPGMKSATTSVNDHDNVFAPFASPPPPKDHFDDLLGSLGRNERSESVSRRSEKDVSDFDDLIPGFGGTSPPITRETSVSSQPQRSTVPLSKSTGALDDPFVIIEPGSVPAYESSEIFSDPLEQINKAHKSDHTNVKSSSSNGVFDGLNSLDDLATSVPSFSSGTKNRVKEKSPLKTRVDAPSMHKAACGEATEEPSFKTSKDASPKVEVSPKFEINMDSADDIWITVSEVPLFTQPTSAPPPSRPPPPRPVHISNADKGSFARKAKENINEFSSFQHFSPNFQSPSTMPSSGRNIGVSSIEELEDFAKGRSRDHIDDRADVLSSEEEIDTNSSAVASAAALKVAMDKAEATFKQRERENVRTGRSRESTQQEKDEKALHEAREQEIREKQERLDREREQREREEKERERRRLEKERERERLAVERATREARERAAADARLRRIQAQAREGQQPTLRKEQRRSLLLSPNLKKKPAPETARRTSSGTSSTMRKASSTTNIVDDLTSIFGGASSSGEFQDVEGETEERRRARLDRHQRTQERAAKALAEKNERDRQTQRDQTERHRIAETLDVEIKRWSAGKQGNLRALLSTLQYVLWPECGWETVSLTDLITGASVKKFYRKATLCVHPDKVQQKGANLQQKYIAEKVFDLLKEAWNKFNSEELF